MNEFDKQRIENALWVLEQYAYDIRHFAEKEMNMREYVVADAFYTIGMIANKIKCSEQ